MAPFSRVKYPRIPLDSFEIRLPIDAGNIPEKKIFSYNAAKNSEACLIC